ncbi:MAG: HEPN domain-containing protein [Sulfurovum sp.]|nr:HEPN domain-containing protein [Sulfurovaceae bacterium]
MYKDKFKKFENIEDLSGKAWEHAVAIDTLKQTNIKDCSIECFHYQQMIELFIKHLLETKSKFGSYSKSHKLNKLLEELIYSANFKTDKSKYFEALQTITICAEQYRYNFMIDCLGYKHAVSVVDNFVDELLTFEKGN